MPKVRCPNCNSTDTIRIDYGLIRSDNQLEEDIKNNKFYPGGCIITLSDPDRHCYACDIDFHMHPLNIYINIDGVLLTNDGTPAKHAEEFLRNVLAYYPYSTYWLTEDCQGDAGIPMKRIGHLFNAETVELMKKIKPTSWNTLKTNAIDLTKPFYWFESKPSYEEIHTLVEHDVFHNLIKVDLLKGPDQLREIANDIPLLVTLPVESAYKRKPSDIAKLN